MLADDDRSDIIGRYLRGVDLRIIAQLAGIKKDWVISFLHANGFEVCERKSGKLNGKDDEITEMLSTGMCDRAVGEKLGVCASAIYQWRKTRGIPASNPYRASNKKVDNKPGPVMIICEGKRVNKRSE